MTLSAEQGSLGGQGCPLRVLFVHIMATKILS